MAWFLVQTKPNSARIAIRNLERQGFETFRPMVEETKVTRGVFSTRLAALFPGYLFLSLDPRSGQWRKVNSTYGVSRLVSFGREPTPVPSALVDDIRSHCNADFVFSAPRQAHAPGDMVEVTTGPFAGLIGEVVKLDGDQRVWMLLDLLGKATRVLTPVDALRATSPKAQ